MSRRRPMHYSAYEPPICLWTLVQQHVPDSEQSELKHLLGESLVDQSLELQDEVRTLLEIWRDMQMDKAATKSPRHLPEPPGVRDRLVQQIIFYVDSIKEKSQKEGRDPDHVLSKCNTEILDYACDSARGSTPNSLLSRPSTARSSRDGRDTPWRQTPSSDRVMSITSEDFEAMNHKLNVLDFDEVSKDLGDYLQQEVNQLLEDIPFLQECLEKATTGETETEDEIEEPSLVDLREERTKLERELLSESPTDTVSKMPEPEVGRRMSNFHTVPSPPTSAGDRSKPVPVKAAPIRSRGPIKASHNINVRVVDLPDQVNPPAVPSSDDANNNLMVNMTSQSSTNQKRPGSADRFRRMVLGCRDT